MANKTSTKRDLAELRFCDDLTKLEEITLDNVLQCLIERYSSSKYYTFAGSMLISMNPCLHGEPSKFINNLNELKQLEKHDDDEEHINKNSQNGTANLKPHIYSIGAKCLKTLISVGNNQVVIVSGDSGAGKTTAIQQLLQYFIRKNEGLRQMQTPNGLDKKICFATSILESMGNASTTANLNSSRFGRFVQLNYEGSNGSIIGASIRTCLLEKHRVSKCSPKERNFHIFYYVLFGLENGIFHMSDFLDNNGNTADVDLPEELNAAADNWKDFIPTHFYDEMKSTDDEDFLALYQSLQSLKLLTELNRVFRIVFGLMVLLSVKFGFDKNNSGSDDEEEGGIGGSGDQLNQLHNSSSSNNEIIVENTKVIHLAANIFGLSPTELTDVLVARKIVAGGPRRKSIFRKPCQSIKECEERLAALTSSLYDSLFSYVLVKVNSMLGVSQLSKTNFGPGQKQKSGDNNEENNRHRDRLDDGKEEELRTLSLLDLYGFECLESNHLEQLCINYANERLHKVYLQNLLNCREELTSCDSPPSCGETTSSELDRIDKECMERIECLNMILFRTLNEECLLNRSPTNVETYDKLVAASQGNQYLRYGKLYDETCPFIVKHYASEVQYQLAGMVSKNLDYVPPEFSQLLQSSTSLCVKTLLAHLPQNEPQTPSSGSVNQFSTPGPENGSTSRKGTNSTRREKTILQRFKISVASLINELSSPANNNYGQEIHFIKCIRPSTELVGGSKIQPAVIQKQLFSSGIVDAIKIVGNGFPIRISKTKFYTMFHVLFRRCQCTLETCNEIFGLNGFRAEVEGEGRKRFQIGKTQVFMSESVWSFFKELNRLIQSQSVRILETCWEERQRRRREQERLAELAFSLASLKTRILMQRNSEGVEGDDESTDSDSIQLNQVVKPELLQGRFFATPPRSHGNENDDEGGSPPGTPGEEVVPSIDEGISSGASTPAAVAAAAARLTITTNLRIRKGFIDAIRELRPILSRFNLGVEHGIVTKGQIYHDPIHFFVRKPALPFGHIVPKWFRSQGVTELIRPYDD